MKIQYILPLFILIVIACDPGTESDNTARLTVGMTDAPARTDSILVAITGIQAKVDSNWVTLFEGSRKIDLLRYRNGKFDLFADNSVIEEGTIHFLRLSFSEAVVYKDSMAYPLTVPNAAVRGIQIGVRNGTIEPGFSYTMLIDFDAFRSFKRDKARGWVLRPLLRAILLATSGKISGTLSGWTNDPAVFAMSGADTVATAVPDSMNAFTLWYLDPGSYSLLVSDTLGNSKTYPGPWVVERGKETTAGTIEK